ncbi:MAG: oligopeptide transporter, OPT family [bacterium LCO1.1]|uniref:Oligopeptide transporter, OPT family n=1 Tax=Candidatus Weimeria bifida TaxID=2599074 RepID=A0A6N7IXH0_9FIRM|nr:oligopeptide transporter, OPT family [Candidatus Weimeria bifida]
MSNETKEFKPFVSADTTMRELSPFSVIVGILLAILFGAANAYLGLKIGMTISASIPAAVISMGLIRVILHRDSILENNMVQTIGSAGESVAAGAIFTLPAMFMWANDGKTAYPSFGLIALICMVGGVLGVLFMVPLRNALIVQEHGTLPYPEGTACAEVLEAGEEGGASAKTVFSGLGIAAVFKFLTDGLKIFPSEITYDFKSYKGAGIGMDTLPSLLGVGYICGPQISSYMLTGGILGWLVLMPLIYVFGGKMTIYPASAPISSMGAATIWSSYIKYIGAGAVACGGIISLVKSLPTMINAFSGSMKGYGSKVGESVRTNKDLPAKFLILGIIVIALLICIVPTFPVGIGGTLLIVIFAFFFVTVSARMVGIVGSSNNPVSGMTIATLLIVTAALKAAGNVGIKGMTGAIVIASIICIASAIAGDTSQDLKTGYIVGATPYKQQIGEIVGVLTSSVAIGGTLYLLNSGLGYGSKDLPAPQAELMKMVVEGVMNGNLPWALIFAGVFIGVVVEIMGIPVMPFAVGLYLPVYISIPMMVGGLIRLAVDKKKGLTEEERKAANNRGILYSSGLIAGEGLVGILLAALAATKVNVDVSSSFSLGSIGSLILFALLAWSLFHQTMKKGK